MDKLTLYTNPRSRGLIAHWMLEETGQPYHTKIVAYGPEMQAEAYRAINPMAKVPALTHGARIVTETAAIISYLADAFPDCALMPDDRAAFYRWMFFAAGPLEQAVVNKSLGVTVPPDKQGMAGYGTFDRVMEVLSAHLSQNDFACGDRFSAADVYIGSQVGWGLQFGTVPALPGFAAYWDRIKDRPARARVTTAMAALTA